MDDEQKLASENNDSNASLAPAADPSVHMEMVLFGFARNAWGNVQVPQEHAENESTAAVPMPPSSAAADEQSLREELLANDSLGG